MILLIDNYDSFVHNLARYLQRLGQETLVLRNDALTADDIPRLAPRAIVLSPGPCTPNEAGCCLEVIRRWGTSLPMLGVCLGHQALAAAWGGMVVRAAEPVHGRASVMEHNGSPLFAELPRRFAVGRYHSLVVDEATLPPMWEVIARTDEGIVMAIAHRQHRLWGVQFHPESILTEHGYPLLANFLTLAGCGIARPWPEAASERPPPAPDLPLPEGPVTF
jgi:anthranilate synthase/aminodeoxychorismate synthase-like glutamine amidotransferase